MPVFISYSFKDEAIYSTLCLALDGAGIPHWDSSQMIAGDSLGGQLRNAIINCEACILIATRSSIESQWCLAETGAFWGAGKKVIIFLADPDLTGTPPQFKGNLEARKAGDLIKAAKEALAANSATQKVTMEFYMDSGDFGAGSAWRQLILDTDNRLDIMGVALQSWRQTTGFKEDVLRKAQAGCRIRFLIMHLENPALPLLATDSKILQVNIPQNYDYFSRMAQENSNVEVRQLRHGVMHFFLTQTDQSAVVVQALMSTQWGHGPLWECSSNHPFYGVANREFEKLWNESASNVQ